MKKFIFILSLIFIFTSDVYAEIYHGIDIDSVYGNGDWSSKNYIKSIIDDNTLLLQYEQEFKNCSYAQNSMVCYDGVAEKILHHFYPEDIENNIKIYHNYTRSVLAAYGVLYCSDKYNAWAGTTCNQETQAKGLEIIKQYILDLIEQMKTNVQKWEFIKNYKR